jgi:Cu+-exporting ATPase
MNKIFNIKGMMCEHCVKKVRESISNLNGVDNVVINLQDQSANVVFDESIVSVNQIVDSVVQAGYQASVEGVNLVTNIFNVEGMMCEHCLNSVTSALQKNKGVKEAQVSLDDKRASVTYDQSLTNKEEIIKAINDSGYVGTLFNEKMDFMENDEFYETPKKKMKTL